MKRRDFLRFSIINCPFFLPNIAKANESFDKKTQAVILKLDDFMPNASGDLSRNWKKTINFLLDNNISASFGLLGDNILRRDNKFSQEVGKLSSTGLFEFWNHGYTSKKISQSFEDTTDEQYLKLCEIQEWVKNITGKAPEFFGPHWTNKNPSTFYALSKIEEIRGIWFYNPPIKLHDRFVVIPRTVEAEEPIFYPNDKSIFNGIATGGTAALQFHPNIWGDESYKKFTSIVDKLIKSKVAFKLPSVYLKDKSYE